jgi:hypothetical protein
MQRLWLCSDKYDNLLLPSELLLTLLDLEGAPEWYRQRADQWPRKAIVYQDVLGLVIHKFTRKIEDERNR